VVTKEAPDPAFLAKLTASPFFAPLDSKVVQEHGGTNAADADKTDTAEEWLKPELGRYRAVRPQEI